MGIVSGIVIFCCTWWLVFFMIMSQGFETDTAPMAGTPKSAPKKFCFRERFYRVSKITCVIYVILDLLIRFDCLQWMLN